MKDCPTLFVAKRGSMNQQMGRKKWPQSKDSAMNMEVCPSTEQKMLGLLVSKLKILGPYGSSGHGNLVMDMGLLVKD